MNAYIEAISTAVPDFEGHQAFLSFVSQRLESDRERKLYAHLAKKSLIERRYSVLAPAFDSSSLSMDNSSLVQTENASRESTESPVCLDNKGLYPLRGQFGSTQQRMEIYREQAFKLAEKAIAPLNEKHDLSSVTHIITASCTGFYAPGIEFEIITRFGMRSDVERIHVGFMGCFAGITTHRMARDIVWAHPEARVLVVNIELCSLHFQESTDLANLLGYLQFADGCSATLVSSQKGPLRLGKSLSKVWSQHSEKIQWAVTDRGFDMFLDLETPKTLKAGLEEMSEFQKDYQIYAVHPGGRGILEAVAEGLKIDKEQLECSYSVLKNYGNMSSATIQFVLKNIIESAPSSSESPLEPCAHGIAMAFGPGLSMEAFEFERVYL